MLLRPARLAVLALALALAVPLATAPQPSCAQQLIGPPDIAPARFADAGPYQVTVESARLEDGARQRTIPIRLHVPDASAGNRLPVVIISHGGGEAGRSYDYLAEHLASHGYLVAAPSHPGSDRAWLLALQREGDLTSFGDIESSFGPRPGDISAVLDWLLRDSRLASRVDPARIAAAGHCMGATTAMAVAGLTADLPDQPNMRWRDSRITAAIALGPQVGQANAVGLDAESWTTVETPGLVIIGTEDFFWLDGISGEAAMLRLPYDTLPTERYLGVLEGGEHHAFTETPPYYPAGARDPGDHDRIQALVTGFLDAVLKNDSLANQWLEGFDLADSDPGEVMQAYQRPGEAQRVSANADAFGAFNPLHEAEPSPIVTRTRASDVSLTDPLTGEDFLARVTIPDGVIADRSLPVILLSPYVGASREEYVPFAVHWAEAGYAVILPDPEGGANRPLPDGESALATWESRARDLITLLDSLARIEAQWAALAGRLDHTRIAVAGHAIGSWSAHLTAGGKVFDPQGNATTFLDPRVDAVLLLSPQGRGQGLTEESWQDIAVPMMTVTGTENHSQRTGNPAEWRTEPFHFGPASANWLAWIEGLDGSYDGLGETRPLRDSELTPVARAVLDVTTAFLDAHLQGDAAAMALLAPAYWETAGRPVTLSEAGEPEAAPELIGPPAVEPPSEAQLAAAWAYSEREGGNAMIVLHEGRIIFERYDDETNADTGFHLFSGTKGFWAPVVAAMIEDGLIAGYDEPADQTIDEWASQPFKTDITLRQLLELNALHVQDLDKLQGFDNPGLAEDMYDHAINVAAIRPPGEVFSYGPVNYYALGEVLKRKLAPQGEDPLQYLERRLFAPLDIRPTDWVHDASGNPHIPNGAFITPRDWIRWGQFLLQTGQFNGQQLVAADLIAEMLVPSAPNVGHGLAIWLNLPGGYASRGETPTFTSQPDWPGGFIWNGGAPELFAAMGAGRNRMYMIPSRNLVIARNTLGDDGNFLDTEFLDLVLSDGGPATDPDPQPEPLAAPETGWYWNPDAPGRGHALEIDGDRGFWASYVYDREGEARWFIALMDRTPTGAYAGELMEYLGGQTLDGAHREAVPVRPVGAVSVATHANGLVFDGPAGETVLERFPVDPQGGAPGFPETGWWWVADEPGRGFFLETAGDQLFLGGYMYDAEGDPVWYISIGAMTDARTYQGEWLAYANGGALDEAARPADPLGGQGALTLLFSAPDTATLTLPDGRTTMLTRFAFGD